MQNTRLHVRKQSEVCRSLALTHPVGKAMSVTRPVGRSYLLIAQNNLPTWYEEMMKSNR